MIVSTSLSVIPSLIRSKIDSPNLPSAEKKTRIVLPATTINVPIAANFRVLIGKCHQADE
jgi:hypothetical protein